MSSLSQSYLDKGGRDKHLFLRCFLLTLISLLVLTSVTIVSPCPSQAKASPSPTARILDLYPYSAETTANKLSAVFKYPDTRFINAILEIDLSGFTDQRKVSVFLTVSGDRKVLKKIKENYKLAEGSYRLDFTELLDLKSVFGQRKLKLFAEVNLSGAPIVTHEVFFDVKGRELPKIRVEGFFLFPQNYQYQDYFFPGDLFTANLFFKVQGLAQKERLRIRVVGIVDDERGFVVKPEDKYFRYDSLWEDGDGPRRDGRYILIFSGYLPRYFYEFGHYEHPFTIHVLFMLDDEIVESARVHGEITVRNPGIDYQTDDEALRTIQISRNTRWRLRQINEEYEISGAPEF